MQIALKRKHTRLNGNEIYFSLPFLRRSRFSRSENEKDLLSALRGSLFE